MHYVSSVYKMINGFNAISRNIQVREMVFFRICSEKGFFKSVVEIQKKKNNTNIVNVIS